MMEQAGRVHGLRALGVAVLIVLAAWAGIAGYGFLRAAALVESLQTASIADVPPIVQQIASYRRWADPRLRRMLADSEETSRDRFHASLALLEVDRSQVEFLLYRLLVSTPSELPVLVSALKPHRSMLNSRLWAEVQAARPGEDRLLRSAAALAVYDPASPRWGEAASKVAEALVNENPLVLGALWLEALRPVSGHLAATLARIFRDRGRNETVHALVTDILASYAADDPRLLSDLLMDADPKAYSSLFPAVQRRRLEIVPIFRETIASSPQLGDGTSREPARDNLARRQAKAAAALIRLGHATEVWPLLRHRAVPSVRGYLINWLQPLGADPGMIASELGRIESETPRTRRPGPLEGVLFDALASTRRALILALGTFPPGALPPGDRGTLIPRLLDRYENDPDAGIHGAAAWTLRQWGLASRLEEIDFRLSGIVQGDRRWYVNRQGQTYVIIDGPVEFEMGSPADEPGRDSDEPLHRRRIPRRFAIADKEVSVRQYPGVPEAESSGRPA